jgi:hypothetical protein
MIEKSRSTGLVLATIAILGQPPGGSFISVPGNGFRNAIFEITTREAKPPFSAYSILIPVFFF